VTPTGAPARPLLPLLAALVTMVLWASAFIVIRTTAVHYSAGAMAFGRLLVGSVTLTLVVRRRTPAPARRLPRGRPLALVVGFGVLWFGLYAVVINAAEQHLDAGTTALLINVAPILVVLLAGLFLGEAVPRTLAIGLAVAFVGVAVIAATTSSGRRDLAGVLLALAAAVLYAVGATLQKQALRDVDPLTATWLGCVVGAVTCLPFAPDLLRSIGRAPAGATAGIVYLGLFPTAVAFTTWAYALANTPVGRLSASSYLVPALTVVLSWLLLAEVPGPAALLGGALCLTGVALTRLPGRRPAGADQRVVAEASSAS